MSTAKRKLKSLLSRYSMTQYGDHAAIKMIKNGRDNVDIAIALMVPISKVIEIRRNYEIRIKNDEG